MTIKDKEVPTPFDEPLHSSPFPLTIERNGEETKEEDYTTTIRIETLAPMHFERAHEIEEDFFGNTGKGCCFGACPYGWCPTPRQDFESFYLNNPDRCSTFGVAVRQDQSVVGIVVLRMEGQKSRPDEDWIHTPKVGELYIDHIAVSGNSRGLGIGTKLMKWTDAMARERGANRITLGVVNGNPAKRLYDRFGFVDTEDDCCMTACIIGMPYGQCGSTMMEKRI